jgi:DNA/RNA-binding domain of Phe-tRNA-synthetase-like protein
MDISFSAAWKRTFAGAHIGILRVNGVDNTQNAPTLEAHKRELETRLRERYEHMSRADLHTLPVLRAYRNYYKPFGNSYHVQLQLESVVHKHTSLPQVSPLVDANFAAELDTFILTAAHDAEKLEPPLTIDVTHEGEPFTQLTGKTRTLKGGDMVMRDAHGAVCTILYGQDQRTAISRQARAALYVAYAPSGVPKHAVEKQLETICELVLSFDENAQIASLVVHSL